MSFSFESLDVYDKAVAFGVSALSLSNTFPERYSGLAEELDRTAIRVSSDIAEGASLWVRSRKKDLFYAARASCFRCASMLTLGRTLGLVSDQDLDALSGQVEAISKMLTKLAQSVDKEREKASLPTEGS